MSRGRVVSISIAGSASAPVVTLDAVKAVAGKGLEGDRYFHHTGTYSDYPGEGRHVTLVECEAVDALNAKLGSAFTPGEMRRNIATRGIALNHLVGRDFRVGEALLRGVRLCEPCEHLESLTRPGVLKQMLHRCGLRADILEGGVIRAGDAIVALDDPLERNKNLVRRFFDEMWNPWNFAKADELLAPEIVFRGTLGDEFRGRDAFRGYMRKVQAAFPDFHNAIEEISAEEDRVVARMRYRGTHRGEIFGIAPTGKAITYTGAAFFRIADGRIVHGWVLGDIVSLLRQLGANPLPRIRAGN